MGNPKIRAVGGPKSSNAEKRRQLYAKAITKAKSAHKNRFYIEAIAIWESIIADRLEARRQFLHPDDTEKHVFGTLGRLIKSLKKEEDKVNTDLLECYSKVFKWADDRNVAVHELVKLDRDNLDNNWKKRYNNLKITSENGQALSKELSSLIRKHNKREKNVI